MHCCAVVSVGVIGWSGRVVCVLIGCVTVIGWSVGVVWVSRHEQYVSLCRGVLRWCVAVCAGVHAGAVARRAGSGFAEAS